MSSIRPGSTSCISFSVVDLHDLNQRPGSLLLLYFVLLAFVLLSTATAMDSRLPLPPSAASDIFSLSDQVLSDKLCFLKEVGRDVWLVMAPENDSIFATDWLWELGQCLVMSP